MTPRN